MINTHDFSRTELAEMHVEYVRQLEAGEISGKEFYDLLWKKIGFHELDAKREWQDIKDQGRIAVYNLKARAKVQAPYFGGFASGEIVSFYGSGVGAVVNIGGVHLPFALFELRIA